MEEVQEGEGVTDTDEEAEANKKKGKKFILSLFWFHGVFLEIN